MLFYFYKQIWYLFLNQWGVKLKFIRWTLGCLILKTKRNALVEGISRIANSYLHFFSLLDMAMRGFLKRNYTPCFLLVKENYANCKVKNFPYYSPIRQHYNFFHVHLALREAISQVLKIGASAQLITRKTSTLYQALDYIKHYLIIKYSSWKVS